LAFENFYDVLQLLSHKMTLPLKVQTTQPKEETIINLYRVLFELRVNSIVQWLTILYDIIAGKTFCQIQTTLLQWGIRLSDFQNWWARINYAIQNSLPDVESVMKIASDSISMLRKQQKEEDFTALKMFR
jgi:hypothetical protein